MIDFRDMAQHPHRLFWFWDAGVDIKLGDAIRGYEADDTMRSVSQIADWLPAKPSEGFARLRENAVRCYPDSEFARKYSRGFF